MMMIAEVSKVDGCATYTVTLTCSESDARRLAGHLFDPVTVEPVDAHSAQPQAATGRTRG